MKKNKKIICIIVFILIMSIFFLEINRIYFIGSVIKIVKPGLIVVEVKESNAPYSGQYYIYSNKKLEVGDIVKVKFKYTPFHDAIITLTSPKSFSRQDYYVKKLNQ